MSIWPALVGPGVSSAAGAVGNLLDDLFTSEEERQAAEIVKAKLAAEPAKLQAAITMVEAGHRSVFVAGWRPFIGWVSGLGLAWAFVGHPLFEWAVALFAPDRGIVAPAVVTDHLLELVVAMLGMGALRTFEKSRGVAR
jgi:hypothetical protein